MEFSPCPTYSIPSSVYGFLRSLDVRSISLNPAIIPTMNPITGWELFVYELPKIELVIGEFRPSQSKVQMIWGWDEC